MEPPERTPSPSVKRGKKACTECRQQKAKCDAYLNPDQPCSRCSKLNIHCVISDPFRREHKRKRLSELEQETDELRRRLRYTQPNHPRPSPIAMLTAAAEMEVNSAASAGELTFHTESHTPSVESQQQLLPSIGLVPPPLPDAGVVPGVQTSDSTEPRTLNNIHLTGSEIDELFHVFFHQYASFLPILDPETTPNTFYTQSPFLFWSIVGIACRTYPNNPTLLTALARNVNEMAFLSVASGASAWHSIQGLLLVLTWPFPKDANMVDMTFPLSGMLLHIAMQNGLHIPMSSHEFSKRKRLPAPSEAEMIRRSELWAHCVIIYQRACVTKGQPPRSLANLEPDGDLKHMLFQRIAPSLALELKCEDLITRCSAAVLEFGVRTMSLEQEKSFDILLRAYDAQALDLEAQAYSAYDQFATTMCRLSIQIFHLFRNPSSFASGCLAQLAITACNTINTIQILGQNMVSLATSPIQMNYALLLAASALMRILKGPQWATMDVDKAKSSFFSAINLAKQMSVDNYDIAAKTVIVLSQLWNSTKAFRKSDGSEYVALRIRSRLVLSPVIDTVWWWRDEFDPQFYSMLTSQGNGPEGTDASRDNQGMSGNAPGGSVDRPDFSYFDEQFQADFEWALTDEVLFTAAEPYGSL
ncbi:putative C6 transcription factor (Leu3) [Aspergillus ibericus CBS 121593]|uniref:C6 zinc finger domain protein n=1 Tax=Aspergillus ibericus CBS 121593 TaxID=1448316 RepID=A0A395HAE2_9EURO|nr:C6 zinc finger domain protein [Aspergillus ibericus CBS 121593]RAL04650.1 C6 zinc finger domain protein [Aspergillus ibericus CBS 121593]